MKILCIGDVVGRPGREALVNQLPALRRAHAIEFCVVNCDNAAGGRGLTPPIAKTILAAGADVLTCGNHVWDQASLLPMLKEDRRVLRPANDTEAVGFGYGVYASSPGRGTETKIAVIHLEGQLFMNNEHSPFDCLDEILPKVPKGTPIIVDMHAEATSEKQALAYHADGKVSAVVGTHTHVQTADERLLPGGTAYISDLGMTGAYDSVIGMVPEVSVQRFRSGGRVPHRLAKTGVVICGAIIDIDSSSGRARSIERLQVRPRH